MNPFAPPLVFTCACCDEVMESGDLDHAGTCPACAIQRAIDDEDYTEARRLVDLWELDTPTALGLHELDSLIGAKLEWDRELTDIVSFAA